MHLFILFVFSINGVFSIKLDQGISLEHNGKQVLLEGGFKPLSSLKYEVGNHYTNTAGHQEFADHKDLADHQEFAEVPSHQPLENIGDHHHGISVVGLDNHKGITLDLTNHGESHNEIFGGTFISTGKEEKVSSGHGHHSLPVLVEGKYATPLVNLKGYGVSEESHDVPVNQGHDGLLEKYGHQGVGVGLDYGTEG